MATVVAIGCTEHAKYSFLLPLACMLWREVIGFEPYVCLIGSDEEWFSGGHTNVVVNYLDVQGLAYKFVPRMPPYDDSTVAQNVRPHIPASFSGDFSTSDWVMLSDADLWPLRREFYHQHENTSKVAACYYANGDNFEGKEVTLGKLDAGVVHIQTLPMCHLVMRCKDWRDLYRLTAGDIAGSLKRTLDAELAPLVAIGVSASEASSIAWGIDQRIVTERLCRQPWFPGGVLMVEREGQPPVDRLDRSVAAHWLKGGMEPFSRWTDAHMPHNAYVDGMWEHGVLPIFEAAIGDDKAIKAWAWNFRGEFVEALAGESRT